MKLTPYKDLLAYAVQHKITIGAFNSFNLESLQACMRQIIINNAKSINRWCSSVTAAAARLFEVGP